MYFPRRIFTYILPVLLMGLLACQDQVTVDPTDPDKETPTAGTPTEVGQPVGAPIVKTIGPAGGTISTPDGKMVFNFPAGVVSKETPITIQPVENKVFNGNGLAYNISAPDTKLGKGAEMTMHYSAEDIESTAAEALGIAYQDEKGVWQGRSNLKVDKAKQTVTAPITHLAHWSFYEQFHLRIAHPGEDKPAYVLAPAESAELVAYYMEGSGDDVLHTPLTPAKTLAASRVVRWTINGITAGVNSGGGYGSIGQIREDRTLAKAIYDAPPREPDTNPVTVAVEIELKEKGHLILSTNIRIESNSFLSLNGSTDSNPNVLLTINNGVFQGAITDKTGLKMVSFSINGFYGKGTYTFAPGGIDQIVARLSAEVSGTHGYYDERAAWHSGNVTVTVSEYKGKGKTMSGTIKGTFYYGTNPFGVSAKFTGVPVVL